MENLLISYGDEGETFERTCPKCGRFVAADEVLHVRGAPGDERHVDGEPNATCSRCGRVEMPCIGFP